MVINIAEDKGYYDAEEGKLALLGHGIYGNFTVGGARTGACHHYNAENEQRNEANPNANDADTGGHAVEFLLLQQVFGFLRCRNLNNGTGTNHGALAHVVQLLNFLNRGAEAAADALEGVASLNGVGQAFLGYLLLLASYGQILGFLRIGC